jgi:tRNA pseudouridine38-40 synthase
MPRYKVTLEYDGSDFVGWQRQDNGPSIQGNLETALFNLCGENITTFGAGRTDAGVHALGQVAHFDMAKELSAGKLADALNFYLKPAPIAIVAAAIAEADFHARFSALGRAYLYRMVERRAPLTLRRNQVWHIKQPLDVAAMHAAAQGLLGFHDFTTYRSSHCQAKSPKRTLSALNVIRLDDEVQVTAEARSFLHNQVRSFVGSLVQVGLGRWSVAEPRAALDACDRSRCGPVAPAQGLFLTRADYD